MACPSPTELNEQYVYKAIDIGLIDEPSNPERETIDPMYLAELSVSIRDDGLIQPLTVKIVGCRYEVTAGHCRLLACRMAKYSPVPCRVQVKELVDPLAILVAENAHREEVNPVEEARFYLRVLEQRCQNDIEKLSRMVKRNVPYLDNRLMLLRGHPRVVDALQDRKINMAVAQELNKIRDENRLLILLDVAINQGATARQVMEWRKQGNELPPIVLPDIGENGTAAAAITGAQAYAPPCLFCGSPEDHHMMVIEHVHTPCLRILKRMLGQVEPGQQEG